MRFNVKRRHSPNKCNYNVSVDINRNQKIQVDSSFRDDTNIKDNYTRKYGKIQMPRNTSNLTDTRHRSLSFGSIPVGRTPFLPFRQKRLSCAITDSTKQKDTKFTSNQKWTLICLSVVSLTSMLSMSIIAPFFPLEASDKGMRETVYSLIFSIYAMGIMIVSPIMGMIMPKIGTKFMLITGVFVAGSANILFGLLDMINDLTIFTVYCFTVRTFEAVGAAAFSTASYTIIMQTFPDNIGTAFGIVETCVGLGMSLGPAIGGGLYGIGGYELPFFVLGGLMISTLPLCWYIIKPVNVNTPQSAQSTQSSKNSSLSDYIRLISIPQVLAVGTVVVIISQTITFLDPTVEPHFREMNISPQYVSLVFLLLSGAYTLFSPIVGWIGSYMDNKFPIMALGLFLSSIGLLLLGPSFLIPIEPTLWLSITSMVLLGISYAVAFIPTFESVLDMAIEHGFDDNIGTYSIVSGLWSSMYSLGEVTGPSLGGILSEQFGFPIAVTVMAGASLFGCIVAGFTCFFVGSDDVIPRDDSEKLWKNLRKNSLDDRSPLLSSSDSTDSNRKYIDYYDHPFFSTI